MDLVPGYISSSLHSLLWAVSCLGLGSFVNRWLPSTSRIEKIVINFIAGCLVWILISLILAAFYLFKPALIRFLVYIAGFGSLMIYGKTWGAWLRDGIRFDLKTATLVIIILVHAFNSLAPVISFDSTCYHLPLASHMLDNGSIIYTPFIFNSAFPKNYEILLAIGLAIGGDASASLVSWWFSLMTVLALVAIGNALNKPSLGIWAGIAISLTPLWFELGRIPKNEVGMAFGITLLVLSIMQRYPGWVIGAAIGWMGGCKYYGFEIGGLAFIAWIIQNRPGWRSVLLSIGVIILAAGYWYASNLYLFANPIFPYFSEIFKTIGTAKIPDSERYVWDVYSQFDQFASPTTLTGWLTAPYRMLVSPSPSFADGEHSAWKWVGWLAILWPFAVIPILKREHKLIGAYLMILIGTALWVTLHGIIYLRFLTPLLVIMYFFSFLVVSDLLSRFKKPKPLARSVATLILCVLAMVHLAGPTTDFSLLNMPLNSEERDIFLEQTFRGWPVIRELNNIDPPPTVYYLYGENARHYLKVPLYSGWRDPYGFAVFREHTSSGAELARWLEDIGVDVLVVNHGRREVASEIIEALSDDEFTDIYPARALMYYSTSVFARREVEIDFYFEPEDSAFNNQDP